MTPLLLSPAQTARALDPTILCAATSPHCTRTSPGNLAITRKRVEVGAVLGTPLDSTPQPTTGGLVQRFQFGAIYWTPTLGAFEVHGLIYQKYLSLQQQTGPLGFPFSDELPLFDAFGRISLFENGAIFYHPDPAIGTHMVFGANFVKWFELGLEGRFLGYPLSDSELTPQGVVWNDFQNGVIYWSSATGAHEVHGEILREWDARGRDSSALGLPVSDEEDFATAKVSRFEGGAIFLTASGIRVIGGPVGVHWNGLGSRAAALGLPVDDPRPAAGGGVFVRFQHGAIYHHPATGAHEVHGLIYQRWASQGSERGPLGYPTSDELTDAHGFRVSSFEFGRIRYNLAGAPIKVYSQNMAMTVYPMSLGNCLPAGLLFADYCGFDKDDAIETLIEFLKRERPEIVALQEMFDGDAVEALAGDRDMAAMYTFIDGPDVSFPDLPISDGGLVLMSRLPVVSSDRIVFPVGCGWDARAAKGVVHARVRTDVGVDYDVFSTHLQDKNADDGSCRPTTVGQLHTVRNFVNSFRGAKERPAVVVGDFNLNGNNRGDYEVLTTNLEFPIDTWRVRHPGSPGQATCGPFGAAGDLCGLTSDQNSTFNAYGDPRGRERGVHGSRLDYVFAHEGVSFQPTVLDSVIINEQTPAPVDLADHFGVLTTFGPTQTLDVDYTGPIGSVYVRLHSFHAMEVTNGTLPVGSEDEVDWELAVRIDGRFIRRSLGNVRGISNDERHFFDPVNGPQILAGPVESRLEIEVEGEEYDDGGIFGETGRVSLGRRSIELTRSQLFEALFAPRLYTLRLMRGDGSAYAAAVSVSASLDLPPGSSAPPGFPTGPIANPEGPQF